MQELRPRRVHDCRFYKLKCPPTYPHPPGRCYDLNEFTYEEGKPTTMVDHANALMRAYCYGWVLDAVALLSPSLLPVLVCVDSQANALTLRAYCHGWVGGRVGAYGWRGGSIGSCSASCSCLGGAATTSALGAC